MSVNSRDNRLYLKLAELKIALDKELDMQHIEKKIIKNDFDINYRVPSHLTGVPGVDGLTALHLAQHGRRIDISKLLLNYGADFTMKSNQGSTALHSAIERAYEYETFRLLEPTHYFVDLILSAHIQSKNFNNPCNNNGISHFHAACTVNNVEAVRFFLDSGVPVNQAIDVNSPFLPGYTALHIAIVFYNLETVDVLLQCNADVYAKNAQGMTPLHLCMKQKVEISNLRIHEYSSLLEKFFERKLKIADKILNLMLGKYSRMDDIGLSHLHISCAMSDSSVATHLLEQDVNLDHPLNMNSPIFAGYTPMHIATQCNINTVKLLITKGANLQLKDSKSWSPLDLCIKRYSVQEVHSMLLCHPVWKDILLVDNKTKLLDLIYALRDSGEFKSFKQNVGLNEEIPLIPTNSPLWPGYSILHLAVTMSNESHEVYVTGMKTILPDSCSSTPIHLVVQKEKYIISKVFSSLIHYYGEIKNCVNQDNLSHLHCICARSLRSSDVIESLLLKDEILKAPSHVSYTGPTVYGVISGSTPLHVAILGRNITSNSEIVSIRLLLKHGADVNAVDAQGFTPIHRLLVMGNYDRQKVGAILLSSPDLKDSVVRNIGLSHLHIASLLDDVESVEKLLDRGADINLRISSDLPAEFPFLVEYRGFTALHMAVKENRDVVLDFLLQHGADMFAKNADGLSLIYEILSLTLSEHLLRPFIDALKMYYTFQRRFGKETGLTMFHVACHELDVNVMKHYWMKIGPNVNVQAHADSPIWSGFTALHIMRNRMRLLRCHQWKDRLSAEGKLINDNLANDTLEFLLKNGADITIADSNRKTALHLFFENMVTDCKKDYTRVSSVLKAQKDFSLNPTDSEGMSHVHIACGMNDSEAVQQFLKHGVIDVNEPNNRGDTPLHLSAGSAVVDFSGSTGQLKTIKLLLKHGAKINVKNNLGNTPLHEAASGRSSVDSKVFEILLKAGADPNVKNIFNNTPLELLCKSKTVTAKHLKVFTKFGCNLNAFNPITDEGFIGLSLHAIDRSPNRDPIWKVVMRLPEVKKAKVDAMGRSVIHNVVSSKGFSAQTFYHLELGTGFLRIKSTYKKAFDTFANTGWDIDVQDKKGETALHKAAKFSNVAAVYALIEAGADMNVMDRSGKTALAYAFEPYRRSEYSILNIHGKKINKILLQQVVLLQNCDFHVCQINQDIQVEATKIDDLWLDLRFLEKLREAGDVKVGEFLSLRCFLSAGMISAYPYTSISNRKSIRKFVNSIDDTEFPQLESLIKMQFRQAEKRVKLVEDATNSLRSLSNTNVPDVCTRIIFESLRNAELVNLIEAAIENIVQ